ncbi:MAG: FG-GAP repeat protein [Bacteroidetes bacterium]|nr:FG-GAP repeat protein [Bacteroidota bacterium]
MKQLAIIVSLILLSFTYSNYPDNTNKHFTHQNNFHDLNCPDFIPITQTNNEINSINKFESGSNGDWYSQITENILEEEYNITYSNEDKVFQSPNRKNNLRFYYNNDGFTAAPRSFNENQYLNNKKNAWEIRISIIDKDYVCEDSELKISGNKAFIENANIRISYINDLNGMRQDFIIKKKNINSKRLELNLTALTDLKMKVSSDAVNFEDRHAKVKMRYSSLKTWDADGKELASCFREISQKEFCIVVNDEDAVYPITIDPVSSDPDWNSYGNQNASKFGFSVSGAGDVNGDNYSDVIVGAVLYDNGQIDEGRAFVYYGSSDGLSSSPDWTSEINMANANFGNAVSTAGDVNGDGYSDVIVGARYYTNGQQSEGGAFVYYGSETGLSNAPDWISEGNQTAAFYGTSVSTAGDVNGDGFSDVVIGAPQFSNLQSGEGRVFLYLGSTSGLATSEAWSAESNRIDANFGNSIALAGDVNGDGYSDIIVGANKLGVGQENEGKVFVYHGFTGGLPATANWTAESNQYHAEFGSSVFTAGDVNGDGYSDVIIGSDKYDNGEVDEGRVFVYHGSNIGLSNTANWTAESNQASAYFGSSVSTAGDVNGDGYSDVIVGAKFYVNGQASEGRAFIYSGSPAGLLSNPFWIDEVNEENANFGTSVCIAGDVNGDGFSDVIVGAPNIDNTFTNEGGAFVYYGSSGNINTSYKITLQNSLSNAIAGDVNGDGYSDVITGDPYHSGPENQEGIVNVFFGSSTGTSPIPGWSFEINIVNANFGTRVSTAGDVNSDGYADVIVSCDDSNGVFLFYGSASGLSPIPNWTKKSHINATTAGDVNGDGFSDLLMSYSGQAVIYYGSASGPSDSADWSTNDYGGASGTAGDVNGDGYSDIIFGDENFSNPDFHEGRAIAYYGSAAGLSVTADWSAEINLENALFGYSVSTAGDVNGDGYSDVVIGAPNYAELGLHFGQIYVYHGSETGLNQNYSFHYSKVSPDCYYGNSVCTAGDVNNDGYSDIIIGGEYFWGSFYNQGRADILLGTESGIDRFKISSILVNQHGFNLGRSVSAAGDVNGDGFSDIIVSNPGNSFVYFGNTIISRKSNVMQNRPGNYEVVYSGGLTGVNGQVRLNLFGINPLGRSDGKLNIECIESNSIFSSSVNTYSFTFTGSANYTDLGLEGKNLIADVSGLNPDILYKWRARVEYNPVNNPFQKTGCWKYYNSYIPVPAGSFRAKEFMLNVKTLDLKVFIQGFYLPENDKMQEDSVTVFLRSVFSPYNIMDSAKTLVDSTGSGVFLFNNVLNESEFYIQINHRNSLETWSKEPVSFYNSQLGYDFTTEVMKAFGDNLVQIDSSPIQFGIYSGDVNKDGVIDLIDCSLIDNDIYNLVTGYVQTDLNGDGIVDIADQVIADNNGFYFVNKITP